MRDQPPSRTFTVAAGVGHASGCGRRRDDGRCRWEASGTPLELAPSPRRTRLWRQRRSRTGRWAAGHHRRRRASVQNGHRRHLYGRKRYPVVAAHVQHAARMTIRWSSLAAHFPYALGHLRRRLSLFPLRPLRLKIGLVGGGEPIQLAPQAGERVADAFGLPAASATKDHRCPVGKGRV